MLHNSFDVQLIRGIEDTTVQDTRTLLMLFR